MEELLYEYCSDLGRPKICAPHNTERVKIPAEEWDLNHMLASFLIVRETLDIKYMPARE